MDNRFLCFVFLLAGLVSCSPASKNILLDIEAPTVPVLALKSSNDVVDLTLVKGEIAEYELETLTLSLEGTKSLGDIASLEIFQKEDGGTRYPAQISEGGRVKFDLHKSMTADTARFTIGIKLKDTIDMQNRICLSKLKISTSDGVVSPASPLNKEYRTGVALRQHNQDGVHAHRIPGLATTKKGTLIALYDARRESYRDLQGDIDICINRSEDGGRTWSPMQVVLDMGEYGGLPQKYNGVSDGAVLCDENTGDLYITGLWMHGVLDPETGKWIKGLTESSTEWNHQWRSCGSQPGYGIKESSQFLIAKSTDDGLTWSDPHNITRSVKKESWWLMAPAPGSGITLSDGTLVFPAEGRTETGLQISTIMYSKDGGNSWKTGNPAYTNTNECMAVQLSDGSIMLNMRERSNRGKIEGNGRAVAVTSDLGETWKEHPTSRNALIESACQGSLFKHKGVLFFFNPSSTTNRDNFTLKCSFDDGMTWPEEYWILIDQLDGNGYSCITSVDDNTLGILYEGSGADMVFLQVNVESILNKK